MNKIKTQPTDKDLYIISELKKAGYGWRKYAVSLEACGLITDLQRKTLDNILYKLRSNQAAIARAKSYSRGYDKSDISDCEAMSFGEYF